MRIWYPSVSQVHCSPSSSSYQGGQASIVLSRSGSRVTYSPWINQLMGPMQGAHRDSNAADASAEEFSLGHGWSPMDFQAVIFAGGLSKNLYPLTSQEVPKCLLPVGNHALVYYNLKLLEDCGFKHALIVVKGEEAASQVDCWLGDAYSGHLIVEVKHVHEEMDSAEALRNVASFVTANDIFVISGDTLSDVSLGAVAAKHRLQGLVATVVLCQRPASISEPSAKGKVAIPPVRDYVGLDSTNQHLLFLANAEDVGKGELSVRKSLLRASGQMNLRMDMMDAHIYIFNREALKTLQLQPGIKNIRRDFIPYLARTQLSSSNPASESSNLDGTEIPMSMVQEKSHAHVQSQRYSIGAYIADKTKYCRRINSLQEYVHANSDVAGHAIGLTGLSLSTNNNVVAATAIIGHRTMIGPACIVGKASSIGEKCSIKKSIIGAKCQIGNNVKITNSVVANGAILRDGCTVANSVISRNADIGDGASISSCFVGPSVAITAGLQVKDESLSKE
ncbi:hypothetical protein CBR_g54067 [Chara braunii]|uniref:Translation initiation factor eIF2B subunit gamma n=1 Tax=Chara braunii TaxID=69332 RepID=A0A388MBL8_CHABU|nr:hypothetical protein CBR_g54067 [Chara braunii]|eukprot:GBG91971.1 hypothetical protein CBR_g54067 [Chara braunii]